MKSDDDVLTTRGVSSNPASRREFVRAGSVLVGSGAAATQ